MYLAEVVEEALQQDGCGDDDGADGGDGPRRRLVQRPRAAGRGCSSAGAAHLLSALVAAALMAGRPRARTFPGVEERRVCVNGDGCRCRRVPARRLALARLFSRAAPRRVQTTGSSKRKCGGCLSPYCFRMAPELFLFPSPCLFDCIV